MKTRIEPQLRHNKELGIRYEFKEMDHMKFLKKLDTNIWISDGDAVSWYGMPYTTV